MKVFRLPAEELPRATAAWIHRNSLLGSVDLARLWETIGGRAVYWAVGDGDRFAALLPGVEFGRGVLTRYQAMPDGLYASLLFPDGHPVDTAEAVCALLAGLAAAGYAKLYVNDFRAQLAPHKQFVVRPGRTLLVDVSVPDWAPPDKKLQSEIRKAEREGGRYDEFKLNRDFDRFLELMKQTERRHGRRPKYPETFYRALGKLAMTDSRVKWLVCEHDGNLAASHIYFVENDMLLNWQVFFDKRFSFLKPNQFLTWSIVRELAPRGVNTLNLGATPGDAESLESYKLKWGGRAFRYDCLERKSMLGRLL